MNKAQLEERRFVRVLVWIVKGLSQRSSPEALYRTYLEKIIASLKSKKSGEEASDGFRVILDQSPFVLNAEMNAVVSPLYRQRFFALVLPQLVSSYNSLSPEPNDAWIRKNHLVALSHLIKFSPRNVTRPAMPQVVPLLLQSLTSEDVDLLHSTLTTFDEIILEADPGAAPFDTQFIPALIDRLILISTSTELNMV